MEFVRYTGQQSHLENLLAIDFKAIPSSKTGPRLYRSTVDQTMKDLMFSVSGKNTKFTLTDSRGNDINTLSNVSSMVNLENMKIFRIKVGTLIRYTIKINTI